MTAQYVAGIDPSINSTGLVILDVPTSEVVIRRSIKPRGKGVMRYASIRDQILDELRNHWSILRVGIEGYAFGMAARSAHYAGELGGVVRVGIVEAGYEYVDVPPSNLKKFVTGKGNAKKDQMLLDVYKRWGVSCDTSDEADALGIAHMVRAMLVDVRLTQYQIEALEKVKTAA